jgi:putative hydrolase of the HAD superfamily
MKLPRAILFDLDDTIISAYAHPERAWRKVTAQFADALTPHDHSDLAVAINVYAREFWGDPDRHKHWRHRLREARHHIVRTALAPLTSPSEDLVAAIADRFTALRDEEMHLFPGAIETLDELRKRGVRMALVTNGDAETQRRKIVRFDLAPHFEHIQIEGEHGFGKPEERAYRHALAALKLTPSDVWMVGDNLEWEVAAPQRLGIYSVWHDRERTGLPAGTTVRPDRIIIELGELLR